MEQGWAACGISGVYKACSCGACLSKMCSEDLTLDHQEEKRQIHRRLDSMAVAIDPLVRAGNQAVAINRPHGLDYHLTKRGSDWLWAVTSLFGLVAVIYVVLFFIAEVRKTSGLTRYSLAAPFLIAFFEFFAYFTYASNLGWTGTQAEFHHVTVATPITNLDPGVRQVFYCKYVAWFLSWPLVLFLQELAAASTSSSVELENVSVLDMVHSLLVQVFGSYFWIIALLVGALIPSTYRWGYWTIGAFTMLVTQGLILQRQLQSLRARGFAVFVLLFVNLIVWLYFICWGLSEGGNRIQPDSEAIFYGILDLCVFAIYPSFLVFLIGQFGTWPSFSFRGGVFAAPTGTTATPVAGGATTATTANPEITSHRASSSDEMNYEKTEGPNSVRDSGETEVPRTSGARSGRTEEESESESV